MTASHKPPRRPGRHRPSRLDPPSSTHDPEPLPARQSPAALRAALDRLLADPGPDIHSLFPCLRDETDLNRLGKDR